MKKEERYTVEFDAYLYARNDQEAKLKAAKIAEFIRSLDDNQANVTRLTKTPFAGFNHKLIHEGRLNIFENKLIEA